MLWSQAQLKIETDTVVHQVSPNLYGLMTEEINHSYEGGLYAELLSNRTLRDTWEGIPEWSLARHGGARATLEIEKKDGPSEALPTSAKLTVATASKGNEAGFINGGFWGIPVKPNIVYSGSFYAKVNSPEIGPFTVKLINDVTSEVIAQAVISVKTSGWTQYQYKLELKNVSPSLNNHFELTVAHPGVVQLQLVSLMPPTYNNRPNGTRIDLMQRMAEMHPRFLRFPGGNYVEGSNINDWFNWKKTIGPQVNRPGHQAPWSYWSTDGFGLLEFLEWCEDLRVEPVLAVFAGYTLDGKHVEPGKDLEVYVQDALDEIEYVTGDVHTKWGAERARNGHPQPFPLHYIEIGNEDFFDKTGSYDARFAQFAKAIRKKYPQYQLIATTPLKKTEAGVEADVVDDHYYKNPQDMMDFVHHYDDAPRSGPKIFIGEWASRSGSPTPNFGDALGDAAWMTALERNSDLIVMSCYAPLFVNVNPGAMQWSTDLIGYNAEKSYVSPSYYAQALFAGHLGDSVVKAEASGIGDRVFFSATLDKEKKLLHLKLVNAMDVGQPLSISIPGLVGEKVSKTYSLHAKTYLATNTLQDPESVHPEQGSTSVSSTWQHTIPALSIEVVDIPLQ